MSKKNVITVGEVINNDSLTPEMMKNLLKEFSILKSKIAKFPKEEVKAARAELGRVSKRVISGKLLEMKDKLVPILKEYREDLKKEFEATVTKDKPQGNKSISFRADLFTVAVIRSLKK